MRNATRGLAAFVPATMVVMFTTIAQATPSAAPGYTLTTFATAPTGSSAPDSIAIADGAVFVGYGNGGNPDGSGGAMSTIVKYGLTGKVLATTTVVGHNDGLRYNAATGQLWALQNEDANPNLVLITPSTLAKSAPLSFSATPHRGGYDDVAFAGGKAFISASNPQLNPNTAPAIVSGTISGSTVNVSGVLAGNASAKVINTGGTTTLNLQDPDSLIFGPGGKLVLDSQADAQLVFVTHPGTLSQGVSVLDLTNQVDDTVFAGGRKETLLFADKGDNTVYALTGIFPAGSAYSAAASNSGIIGTDFIGLLDQLNGTFTPVATGLSGPGGEAFLAVPEPASVAVFAVGLLALVGLRRRSAGGYTSTTGARQV